MQKEVKKGIWNYFFRVSLQKCLCPDKPEKSDFCVLCAIRGDNNNNHYNQVFFDRFVSCEKFCNFFFQSATLQISL